MNHKTALNQSTGLNALIVLQHLRTSLFTRCEGRVSWSRSLAHLLRRPDKEVFTRVSLTAAVNKPIPGSFSPHSNGLTEKNAGRATKQSFKKDSGLINLQ